MKSLGPALMRMGRRMLMERAIFLEKFILNVFGLCYFLDDAGRLKPSAVALFDMFAILDAVLG